MRISSLGILSTLIVFFGVFSGWADDRDGVVRIGDLEISDVRMRLPLIKGRPTAAYLTIVNTGQTDDELIVASSDLADEVQLHNVERDGVGLLNMIEVARIVLPAGQTVHLAPGGYHMMVMGLSHDFRDEYTPFTLRFRQAGQVQVVADVVALPRSNDPQHSHDHDSHHHQD